MIQVAEDGSLPCPFCGHCGPRRFIMTYEEAVSLRHFKHYCTCGGYAWRMNGREEASPHMNWCLQREEYREWYKAIHSKDNKEVYHE